MLKHTSDLYKENNNYVCLFSLGFKEDSINHLGFLIRDSLEKEFILVDYYKNLGITKKFSGWFIPIKLTEERQQELVKILQTVIEKNKEIHIPFGFEKDYTNIFSFDYSYKQSEGLNCSLFILSILSFLGFTFDFGSTKLDKDKSWFIQNRKYLTKDSCRYEPKLVINFIESINENICNT